MHTLPNDSSANKVVNNEETNSMNFSRYSVNNKETRELLITPRRLSARVFLVHAAALEPRHDP